MSVYFIDENTDSQGNVKYFQSVRHLNSRRT